MYHFRLYCTLWSHRIFFWVKPNALIGGLGLLTYYSYFLFLLKNPVGPIKCNRVPFSLSADFLFDEFSYFALLFYWIGWFWWSNSSLFTLFQYHVKLLYRYIHINPTMLMTYPASKHMHIPYLFDEWLTGNRYGNRSFMCLFNATFLHHRSSYQNVAKFVHTFIYV